MPQASRLNARLTHLPRHTLLALACCSALAACGGGGESDTAPVATPLGAGFASGAIAGFGSVIVNGVHFDETSAAIRDEDGAARSADALKLGMVVEIAATPPASAADGRLHAAATSVQYRSEIEGPVAAIDLVARTVSVLGQTLQIKDTTVFEDELRGGLAALKVGDRVEAYGFLSSTGQYTLTRIELEDADDRDAYKLRGLVGALDTARQRFQLGGITISYAGPGAPAGLADGALVRVELQRSPDAAGLWPATRLSTVTPAGTATTQSLKAEIEGHITALQGATRFHVDGVAVDAGTATRLPGGLAVGQMVEVEGVLLNGVLTASSIELERRLDADEGFQVEGRIASVDAAAGSFSLRGVTVSHAGSRFVGGTAAQLQAGIKVEVKGQLSGDGVTLVASEVEFDD